MYEKVLNICITLSDIIIKESLSLIGILLSIVSIIIALVVYKKQCNNIYKLNYNRISYSSIESEIMDIKNELIFEIDCCIDDINWCMKDTNVRRIDAEDEMREYMLKIGRLMIRYISVIRSYMDSVIECNSYKHSNRVDKVLDAFNNTHTKLINRYTISKFKDINGNTRNITFQSFSELNNRNIFECIADMTVDTKSFEQVLMDIKELVIKSQIVERNGYYFTIQDIKYLLNGNDVNEDSYNYILDNYIHTIAEM